MNRRIFVSDVQSFMHHIEAAMRAWESIKNGLEGWGVGKFDQIDSGDLEEVKSRLIATDLLLGECLKLGELLEVLSSYMPNE